MENLDGAVAVATTCTSARCLWSQIFILSISVHIQTGLFLSRVRRHSCQFPGIYGAAANGADAVYCEYRGVMWRPEMTITTATPLHCASLPLVSCVALSVITPLLAPTHFIFNCISISISIWKVEAVQPNGVLIHTHTHTHTQTNTPCHTLFLW